MRKAADREESETERAGLGEGETDEREPIRAWRREFDSLKPYGPIGRRKQKIERPAKSEDPN